MGEERVFQGARLRLARRLRAMRQNELATKVELTPAAISQYEKGTHEPSPEVVERLAMVLTCLPDFFYRPLLVPDSSSAFFRSLRSTPQAERDRAHSYALVLAEIAELLDEDVELPVPRVPRDLRAAPTDSMELIEARAAEVRRRFGIESGAVPHVVNLLEANGVVVSAVGDFDHRLDAFSMWVGARPVAILCSAKGVAKRRRFDAAHELAHLVLHGQPDDDGAWQEPQAHRFAAALLMPADEIEPWLPRRSNQLELLEEGSETWGVSMQALLYRARVLGTLSDSSFTRAMRQMSAYGWRTDEPVEDGPEEAPVVLSAAVESLLASGGSIQGLAVRLGMPKGRLCRMVAVPEERATEPRGTLVGFPPAAAAG
jgi:Zn-dependent peptidase ImmA (M78 family)/DNA-binding XRE family transcriptional regulator